MRDPHGAEAGLEGQAGDADGGEGRDHREDVAEPRRLALPQEIHGGRVAIIVDAIALLGGSRAGSAVAVVAVDVCICCRGLSGTGLWCTVAVAVHLGAVSPTACNQ